MDRAEALGGALTIHSEPGLGTRLTARLVPGDNPGSRMSDLRASRSRIVATGDAERRRLERDLHDGAQQRLLALTLTVQLLCSATTEPARVDEAVRELRAAVESLRTLARGLFPAVLTDEGLDGAVPALLEETAAPIALTKLPGRRLPPAVEAAAYFVIAEAIAHHATAVSADVADDRLVLGLEGAEGLDMVRIQDRIGALESCATTVERAPHGTSVRVEIPCAS